MRQRQPSHLRRILVLHHRLGRCRLAVRTIMIDEQNNTDREKQGVPQTRRSQTNDVPNPCTAVEISSENRDNTRYPCEGSVEFLTEGSEVRTFAELKDLSFGGCSWK